ncbi:hypothetical protein BpHYR1_045828 [Brachionus plicatilis]|uniref:Uncharacterized protein n=1 Tax=Brachionus plicatilis TaxID=10195 RepID=A0A3M7RRC1_BRAPC|nr:hypothetical protein BpHYR1_045828 [Brachionus plicatilis]
MKIMQKNKIKWARCLVASKGFGNISSAAFSLISSILLGSSSIKTFFSNLFANASFLSFSVSSVGAMFNACKSFGDKVPPCLTPTVVLKIGEGLP